MKTRKVFNIPGHAHEWTFSCYRGLPLLNRDRTRQWLVEALDAVRCEHSVALIAYVIMPEHTHILLKPRLKNTRMEQVQKAVKQSVARRALGWLRQHEPSFLARLAGEWAGERRRYHFWQPGGGYDRNVATPYALLQIVEYIHANPVRRGLVAQPLDWHWSSARFWDGLDDVRLAMDRDVL